MRRAGRRVRHAAAAAAPSLRNVGGIVKQALGLFGSVFLGEFLATKLADRVSAFAGRQGYVQAALGVVGGIALHRYGGRLLRPFARDFVAGNLAYGLYVAAPLGIESGANVARGAPMVMQRLTSSSGGGNARLLGLGDYMQIGESSVSQAYPEDV